jgi:type I restriction enzyme S subunit
MEHIESGSRRLLSTIPATEMKSSSFHFHPGDVLYGRLRPYLNKVFYATFEGLCSSEFIVLPQSEAHDSRFLAMYLSTDGFVEFANQLNKGDRPRVSWDQISDHNIPLPPRHEQERIADGIEILSDRIGECQQRLERIPILLKRFRQSVLAAACSGKLTEDWRERFANMESADEILQSHAAETASRERNMRRLKPANGLTLLDYSTELPQSWTWKMARELVRLGAIIDVQDGNHGELYPRKEDFAEEGVPYISAESVSGGRILSKTAPRLKPGKASTLRIGFTKPGDVILTHNATVGRVAIIPPELATAVLSTSTTYYRTDPDVLLPEYLYLYLSSELYQTQLRTVMEQTTRNQVPVTKQVELSIAVPHPKEQKLIAVRAQQLLLLADQMEIRYSKARAYLDKLTPAILAKAFRGELVPQDPNDEPAEKLLERIRAARSEQGSRAASKEGKSGRPKSRKKIALTKK